MKDICIKLVKKLIILLIITVLPLVGYLYLDEDAQTTLMANVDNNMNKYIIESEIRLEEQKMFLYEKIILRNNRRDSLEKVYINTNLEKTKIISAYVNGIEGDFKEIGKEKKLLLVFPEKIVSKEQKIVIELTCEINMSNYMRKKDSNAYILTDWYPVVTLINDNNLSTQEKTYKVVEKEKNNFNIKINIPSNYSIGTNRMITTIESLNNDNKVYNIEYIGGENIVLIVRKK